MTKLTVPAAAARPGPPLSPILGQAQVKVADFVTQFNSLTAEYIPGVPLGVRVTKAGQKFTLRVRPPAVVVLLWGCAIGRVVNRVDLWGCTYFRYACVTPAGVTTTLGTLKSAKLTVR